MEQAIAAWLDAGVLWGESSFGDKDEVKSLILQPRNRRWDASKRLWGSTSKWDARRLIQSNCWWPSGVDRSWRTSLLLELEKRIAAAEQEMQTSAAAVSEKKRAATMPTTGPSWEDRQKLQQDRERGIRECTDEEKRTCADLGLNESTVAASLKRETVGSYHMGPRAGLSASERVLRLVRLEKNAARVHGQDEEESVKKLVSVLTSADWDETAEAKAVKAKKQKMETKKTAPVAASKEKVAVEVKKEVPQVVRQAVQQSGPIRLSRGECQHCRKPVSIQFLACGCFNKPWSEKWVVCRVCEKIVNPVLRECPHVKKD